MSMTWANGAMPMLQCIGSGVAAQWQRIGNAVDTHAAFLRVRQCGEVYRDQRIDMPDLRASSSAHFMSHGPVHDLSEKFAHVYGLSLATLKQMQLMSVMHRGMVCVEAIGATARTQIVSAETRSGALMLASLDGFRGVNPSAADFH